MIEAQQLETGQNAINQNNGFNGADNPLDMNTVQPGSRSDQISSGTNDIENVNSINSPSTTDNLPNNINRATENFKPVHLTVGAGRTAADGAIHITAGSQRAAGKIISHVNPILFLCFK